MGSKSSHYIRLAGIVSGLTLIVAVLVMLMGFISSWSRPVQYSNAFFVVGAIFIVLGVFSIAGGFAQRADFKMTYAESAGQANLAERSRRMMADISQRYGAMTLLIGTGVLLVLVSILIGQFLL